MKGTFHTVQSSACPKHIALALSDFSYSGMYFPANGTMGGLKYAYILELICEVRNAIGLSKVRTEGGPRPWYIYSSSSPLRVHLDDLTFAVSMRTSYEPIWKPALVKRTAIVLCLG